jgi:hypothetical protein
MVSDVEELMIERFLWAFLNTILLWLIIAVFGFLVYLMVYGGVLGVLAVGFMVSHVFIWIMIGSYREK